VHDELLGSLTDAPLPPFRTGRDADAAYDGGVKVPVTIRELVVGYGGAPAVAGVSLGIEPGELFLLLGPSGCGKTTLLRAIAGFAPVQTGSIFFGDEDVTHLPAHRRHAGMVFQSFALWPHLTVAENVAFGLREQGVSRSEIKGRVAEALRSTQIADHGPRSIDELSGGEQQRVALARALVVRPRCLLLDEPLSNLDAKLRRSMREEIRRICKSFGLTTIYVTHDQKEALAVADRIAVMRAGRILQVGRPDELYRRPRSCAVASFIGETNLLKGRVTAVTSEATVMVESVLGTLVAVPGEAIAPVAGQEVWISIRPECLRRASAGESPGSPRANVIRGEVAASVYLGELAERQLTVGDARLSMYELNPSMDARAAPTGEATSEWVAVAVDPADVQLLPMDEPQP
jgi:iron(III) transport system ATP-binding protein